MSQNPSDEALECAQHNARARSEIVAGRLPTTTELLSGQPFKACSAKGDVSAWAIAAAQHDFWPLSADVALAELASSTSSVAISKARREIADCLTRIEPECDEAIRTAALDASQRLRIYAAFFGDHGARRDLGLALVRDNRDFTRRTLGLALLSAPAKAWSTISDMEDLLRLGRREIDALAAATRELRAAEDVVEKDAAYSFPAGEDLDALLEDRSEIQKRAGKGLLDTLRKGARPRLRVVPAAPTEGGSARRDVWKSFAAIAGQPLDLVERGDVVGQSLALQIRFPHAKEAISTVLRDVSSSPTVRLRPTLFVGSPGCGKTTRARAGRTAWTSKRGLQRRRDRGCVDDGNVCAVVDV